MPIFEYSCADCAHTFETLFRTGDEPRCPRCQSLRLEKLYSAFGITSGGGSPVPRDLPLGGG